MAAPGESIENPATGERIEFRQLRGDLLEFELTLAPRGVVGGVPHRHPVREETVVHEGLLSARVQGRRRDVAAGESLVIPPDVGHYLFNDTEEPIRATVTVVPPREYATFFETTFAIAQQRRYRAFRGLPPPLHAALLAYTYEVYAPLAPIRLQRALLRPLADLARRRGYPTRLP